MTGSGSEIWLYYVDHTVRFARNTGIQRCVRSLARSLLELGVSLQPVVWDRNQQCLLPASAEARDHLALWGGPSASLWADKDRSFLQQQSLLPAQRLLIVELVSGPHNPSGDQLEMEASRLKLTVAWLFHDAIPWRLESLYGDLSTAAAHCHGRYMTDLARFQLVLANSQTTASHLNQFWQEQGIISGTELKVVRLAEEFPAAERLPPPSSSEKLMLCVGSLEPRKNHRGLLKALAALVADQLWPIDYTLVLVGWPNDAHVVAMVERAVQLGLPLRWEHQADDQRLLELYRQARCCVFPSLEEGFGLPVAESLWHRRPCLCSAEGALQELAAGGGCLTVTTSDWKQLRQGLYRLATDSILQNQLQQQIDKRPLRRWQDVASELRSCMACQT